MNGRWASLTVAVASLAALVFGCPSSDPVADETTAAGAGAGDPTTAQGTTASGVTTTSGAQSSSAIVTTAASTGPGGGSGSGCDPSDYPGTLFELSAQGYVPYAPIDMCKYRGNVLLIFNSAAI